MLNVLTREATATAYGQSLLKVYLKDLSTISERRSDRAESGAYVRLCCEAAEHLMVLHLNVFIHYRYWMFFQVITFYTRLHTLH